MHHLLLAVVAFTTVTVVSGLTCYSCNTDGAGPDCIDHPEKYTTVACPPEKNYCYTTRVEREDPENPQTTIIDVDRSCCFVANGSPTCPVGENMIIQETEQYTKYLTRCKGDLCNNDRGDHTGGGNNDDDDGGIIIIPGGRGNVELLAPPSPIATIVFATVAVIVNAL